MTEPTYDQICDLLGCAMAASPEPHTWADVERRAAGFHDPSSAPRRTGIWLAAACVIAIVAGFVVFIASEDDRRIRTNNDTIPTTSLRKPTPTTTQTTQTTSTTPTTTSPQVTKIIGNDAAVIGETIIFDDGGMARVNAVTRDAPTRNTLYGPLSEGDTSTEIEVEHCIGGDEYRPTLLWQPPERWFVAERWTGILDDGTEVKARAGYYMEIESRPGACSRGYVTIPTPSASNVVAMTLSLGLSDGVEPNGIWDLSVSRPIEAPLQPATLPEAAALGEPVGPALLAIYNVTVLEVIDDASPKPSGEDLSRELNGQAPTENDGGGTVAERPDVGRKLVEIRAKVCTDSSAPAPAPRRSHSTPQELRWLIETSDHYVGNGGGESSNGWDSAQGVKGIPGWSSTLIVNGNFASGVPANGECIEGYVQIDLPDDALPAYAIITAGDGHFREIGRIRLSE